MRPLLERFLSGSGADALRGPAPPVRFAGAPHVSRRAPHGREHRRHILALVRKATAVRRVVAQDVRSGRPDCSATGRKCGWCGNWGSRVRRSGDGSSAAGSGSRPQFTVQASQENDSGRVDSGAGPRHEHRPVPLMAGRAPFRIAEVADCRRGSGHVRRAVTRRRGSSAAPAPSARAARPAERTSTMPSRTSPSSTTGS